MSQDARLRAYLLGQATQPLDDPETWARLEVVESTLIDDYVLGTLTGTDRTDFETHYLTTGERRAQVAFARSILQQDRREGRRRMAFTVLPLLMALIAVIWSWKWRPHETAPVLALSENAHRGPGAPKVQISTLGKTLTLELHLSTPPPGPATAVVHRIGLAEPLLQLRRIRARSLVTIPIPSEALEPGDYSITLATGTVYRQDFVFQVEP